MTKSLPPGDAQRGVCTAGDQAILCKGPPSGNRPPRCSIWGGALRSNCVPVTQPGCNFDAAKESFVAKLRPFYEDVQAHYDVSDDFYRSFLDESMTYSCAYFERDDMTLEEAQTAKIDLSLGKCDLKPGMRLLDVGCGWGSTALRAAEKYGVRVVGLTLSKTQHRRATERAAGRDDIEFRLQGWEEFDEPVDRIVSIGALEHFRIERYADFFGRCRKVLPDDGRMMIHSIVHGTTETIQPGEPDWDAEFLDYVRFFQKLIFPGGQVPPREMVQLHAQSQGFQLAHVESLRLHYARTLDQWAKRLEAAKDQAVAVTNDEVYESYVRYLTQSARYFRSGHCDVLQFTFQAA